MSSASTFLPAPTLKVQAAPAPGLTEGLFLQHMTGMQAHYSPGGAGMAKAAPSYALPPRIVRLATPTVAHAAGPAVRPAPPAEVSRTFGTAEQDALGFVNGHHKAVLTAINGAQAANDASRFVQAMRALEQQEMVDHAARIHVMFQGLIAAGQAHPGHQAQILVTTNQAGSFMAGLLHSAQAVSHAIAGALGAGRAAAGVFHDAAQAAGHWASDAVQSVGGFFKSLF